MINRRCNAPQPIYSIKNKTFLHYFLQVSFTYLFLINLTVTPKSTKSTERPPSTINPLRHRILCKTTTAVPKNNNNYGHCSLITMRGLISHWTTPYYFIDYMDHIINGLNLNMTLK